VTAQFFFAGSNHPAGYADYALPTIFTPPSDYAGSLPAGSTTSQLFYSWRNATLAGNSQIYEGKVTYHLGNGQLQVAALSNTSGYSVNQNYPTGPLTLQLFGGGLYCLTPPCSATPGTPPGTSAFTPVTFNGSMQTVMLLQNTLDQSEIVHNRDLSVNYASAFSDRVRATISFVHSYYDDMSPTNCLQLFQNGNGTVGSFSYVSQPQSNFEATDQFRVGLGANPSDRVSVDLSSYFANARYHVVNPADATENTYIDEYYHYAAPRLSFVWRPNHNWAVRASTGGGFALAPLSDLDSGNYGIFCSSVCSQYVANTNLQPETSWGYDVGFDTRFAGSTILSFDAYSTNLKGQVYNNTAPAGTHLGVPLFTIQYRNLGQSRYEGIQLDLHHDVPKGMIWSISGSLMRGYIVSLPAGFYNGATCTNCANGLVVPGINFNGLFTNANIPYAQGFALWGYNWSPDRFVNLEVHYFGNNNGYYAPAFVAFDANLQVPLTRNVAMQGTFHNITGILDNAVTNGGQGIIYPAVNGPNAFEFSVPYGPRTFLLTLRIHS
jgi:outer membrane receptor protein involved in Fe transport